MVLIHINEVILTLIIEKVIIVAIQDLEQILIKEVVTKDQIIQGHIIKIIIDLI